MFVYNGVARTAESGSRIVFRSAEVHATAVITSCGRREGVIRIFRRILIGGFCGPRELLLWPGYARVFLFIFLFCSTEYKEIKNAQVKKRESQGTRWFLYVRSFILITNGHFVDQPSSLIVSSLPLSLSLSIVSCTSFEIYSASFYLSLSLSVFLLHLTGPVPPLPTYII